MADDKATRKPTEVTLRIRAMAKVERLKAKIKAHGAAADRLLTDLHMAEKEVKVLSGEGQDQARPSVGGPADA